MFLAVFGLYHVLCSDLVLKQSISKRDIMAFGTPAFQDSWCLCFQKERSPLFLSACIFLGKGPGPGPAGVSRLSVDCGVEVIPTLRRVVPRRQEKGAEMLGEPTISLHSWMFGDQPPRWDDIRRNLVIAYTQGPAEAEEQYRQGEKKKKSF